MIDPWPREKNWKLLYTRSVKLARAHQLGFEYPRITEGQLARQESTLTKATSERRNVLFVCSKNEWRSPTAEAVWRRHPMVSARSAGTASDARRKVSVDDIRWADVICVMEEKHKARLLADFTQLLRHKPLHVLDIPDEYRFMDAELVEELERSVGALLALDD